MYLSEQLRQVRDEENLVAKQNLGSSPVTEFISLPKAQILYVSFTLIAAATGVYNCEVRVNNVPRLYLGAWSGGAASSITRWGFFRLPAGNYMVRFDPASASADLPSLSAINIGRLAFADTEGFTADSGNVSMSSGQIIDPFVTINIPASSVPARRLPMGTIREYTLWATVAASADERRSKMRHGSESDASSAVNYRIKVDGVERDWTQRQDDDLLLSTNPSLATGAHGLLVDTLAANQSHTITVRVRNLSGAGRTVRVVVSALLCPWIIPGLADVVARPYEPLLLDVPKGSTIYAVVEPLYTNTAGVGNINAKYIRLGKRRFLSFGDSTDYYSSASANTGILSWNYTFETVDPVNVPLVFQGPGSCIGAIAADIR